MRYTNRLILYFSLLYRPLAVGKYESIAPEDMFGAPDVERSCNYRFVVPLIQMHVAVCFDLREDWLSRRTFQPQLPNCCL